MTYFPGNLGMTSNNSKIGPKNRRAGCNKTEKQILLSKFANNASWGQLKGTPPISKPSKAVIRGGSARKTIGPKVPLFEGSSKQNRNDFLLLIHCLAI